MKILNPTENIDRIIAMIENSKEFIVIVSPFNDLTGWDNLKNAINKASENNIDVSYYVRAGEGTKGIEGLNVNIFEVPNLHAKMFFNESEALISSGNLTNKPDINWVYLLIGKNEYDELAAFFEDYIKPLAKPL